MEYLGRPSFWFDELAVVLNIQERGLADLVSRPLARFQMAPAAFLASVKVGSELLGMDEIGLRIVPWLSALAGVFLFWRVAVRMLAGAPLLLALSLFSVSPSLIWYSCNVKPYSGDVAATLLLVLLSLRFQERPQDRRSAVGAGAIGGAALFFSYPAVVAAGVLGLILAWRWLRDRPRGSPAPLLWLGTLWAIAALAAGLVSVPLTAGDAAAYMRRFWAQDFMPAPWEGLAGLLWIPDRLFAALGFHLLFIAREWAFGPFVAGACAALACLGVFASFRTSPWVAALIAAPTLSALLAAAVRLLPLGLRVSLHAGWPLALFAMAGLQALRRALPDRARWAPVALGALVASVPAALVLVAYRPPFHHQESRPVLEELARRWRPGDTLFVYYGGRYAAEFYGRRLGLSGWDRSGCHRGEPRQYFREIDHLRGRARVWLFYTHAAEGYREPAVIRSYLETIGTERDRIPDPFGSLGQSEAAAYLYDLSDPGRLAAATWTTHRFPEPTTGGPRILCDGTWIPGQ